MPDTGNLLMAGQLVGVEGPWSSSAPYGSRAGRKSNCVRAAQLLGMDKIGEIVRTLTLCGGRA